MTKFSITGARPAAAAFALWTVVVVSQAQPGPELSPFLIRPPTYTLVITKSAPASPILENSAIRISFALTTRLPYPGEVLDSGLSVCPTDNSGVCKAMGTLAPGRRYTGSLTMRAPRAGVDPTVRITLCGKPKGGETYGCVPLAEGELPLPVYARYEVALTGFEVLHTRAHTTDTLYAALNGRVAGQRSAEADACSIEGPPLYCVPGRFQGNREDGQFPIAGVKVGPFDLMPEVDADLTFAYSMVNFGTPKTQLAFKKFMDTISDIASMGLTAYQPQAAAAWQQGNDFTHRLNDLQWGGCDGPVAAGEVVMLNRTLAGQSQSNLVARTDANGQYSQTSDIHEITSQDGCGNSSKYRVRWVALRTSWMPPR